MNMRKQYFTYLIATLVAAMTPVLAQSASFELHRDVQAASVSQAPIVDTANLSPLNDVLDDGIDRFYMVSDAEGGSPVILLSKNRVSGRVDVTFDDG